MTPLRTFAAALLLAAAALSPADADDGIAVLDAGAGETRSQARVDPRPATAAHGAPPTADAKAEPWLRVGVPDFVVLSGDPYLAFALPVDIAAEMKASGGTAEVLSSVLHPEAADAAHFADKRLSYDAWRNAGARAVLLGKVEASPEGHGRIVVEYRLVDVHSREVVSAKRFTTPERLYPVVAEKIAAEIREAYTEPRIMAREEAKRRVAIAAEERARTSPAAPAATPKAATAAIRPYAVAFPALQADGVHDAAAARVAEAVSKRLSATGLARFGDHQPVAPAAEPYYFNPGQLPRARWREAGFSHLLFGRMSARQQDAVELELRMVDLASGLTAAADVRLCGPADCPDAVGPFCESAAAYLAAEALAAGERIAQSAVRAAADNAAAARATTSSDPTPSLAVDAEPDPPASAAGAAAVETSGPTTDAAVSADEDASRRAPKRPAARKQAAKRPKRQPAPYYRLEGNGNL